ncbi:hypothetical protein EB796_013590 [Bugula neritina]|uniref:Uncharacterized protein n=1 Tax=Bugula neritina TaxID=10212 RepID=A0A7J7JP15_BUGNE|nr:hypothetical protein EB796_013590 [Bugula neritina]
MIEYCLVLLLLLASTFRNELSKQTLTKIKTFVLLIKKSTILYNWQKQKTKSYLMSFIYLLLVDITNWIRPTLLSQLILL